MNSNGRKTVVIGAGLGGLYCAYLLARKGIQVTIIEKSKFVGGLSGSLSFQGCQFDFGPHYISLYRDSSLMEDIREVLGSDGIVELKQIRQRYKAIYKDRLLHTSSISIPTALWMDGPRSLVQGTFSYAMAQIKRTSAGKSVNPGEVLSHRYGQYLYENSCKPTILHAMGTLDVSRDYVDRTFPEITPGIISGKIRSKIRQRRRPSSGDENSVIDFYPKYGMGTLARALQSQIETMGGIFIFDTCVTGVQRDGNYKTLKLSSSQGASELHSNSVVYTSPLPSITSAGGSTTRAHARLTYLCVDSPTLFDGWVIGEFDGTRSFFRVSQQTYLSPHVAPDGKSVLCVETRCSESDPLWTLSDEELKDRIVTELGSLIDLSSEKVIAFKSIRIPKLYRLGSSTEEPEESQTYENEYLIGAPLDDGNLATFGGKNRGITWLGGIQITMTRAEQIASSL